MEGPASRAPRTAIYSGYKGNRPDERATDPYIHEVLQMLHVLPITIAYAHEREADDMIDFIARHNSSVPKIVVYSNDHDLWTLAAVKNVFVLSEHEWVDDDAVEKKFGVPMDKIPMYKAIYGDASDCIPPAVKKLPTKYAPLFAQFKDIDDMLKILIDTDEKGAERLGVKYKWVEAIKENRKNLWRNHKLVSPLPIKIGEDIMDRGNPNLDMAMYLIRDIYECKSLYGFIEDMFKTPLRGINEG